MGSDIRAVVIMGVSGSGKSTVAEMLASALDCSFLEADDFHSQANKDKMRKGISLKDEDRIPWLESLRDAIKDRMASGNKVVLACSALQKKYRDVLRTADPEYMPSDYTACSVKFVCLEVSLEVLNDRLDNRLKEGKHFMPASLLRSQLDLLQIEEAEGILKTDSSLSPQATVESILAHLKGKWEWN